MQKLSHLIRALRLPFISVSVIPFMLGSFLAKDVFSRDRFFLGLAAAVFTHLGANLINDYADSQSGADWQDKKFYGFFGGSKLIQEGIFSERFYLKASLFCFSIAFAAVVILAIILQSLSIFGFYFFILFLGASYSLKPLQFSYHKLGEVIIFILFGPALVMGGYFIQTQIFPDAKSFLLSLPLGFLTTAILFANEVPDYEYDKKSGKNNWVALVKPQKAYLCYLSIIFFAFVFIGLNISLGHLKQWAALSFLFILPALRAAVILKKGHADRMRLIESSKLVIATHALVGLSLILGVVL